eukprot:1183302-Prorocentrum_minimum.AAC.1
MLTGWMDRTAAIRDRFETERLVSSWATSIPFGARHFEYSTEYSTYIPCRQTAIGWDMQAGESEDGMWSQLFHRHPRGPIGIRTGQYLR